ncbi:MAG: RNA-binding protein [candidate division Zixibacteria bacterium]|nr:RNA-binding protein [candidate division Zixibacteria bacterium]
MKIFVDNLAFEIMDDFLRAAFEQFGQVTSATIAREHNSSDSRGYAFVDMPVESEARTAIAELNGLEMMGRAIEVTEARADSEARRNKIENPRKAPWDRSRDEERKPAGGGSGPRARYGRRT